ncbi:MAG: hypothetical protein HY370_01345 [Proteobacteria bacterium]|nr:hypothetical protein [Pseudomonadota bacterium]
MTIILWGAWNMLPHEKFADIFPVLVIVVIVVTLFMAAILHYGLERPARRWLTGLLTR